MGCRAPQDSCCLLSPLNLLLVCFSPFLKTSRAVTTFSGVRIKSALSGVALAVGQVDGTKMIFWATSPLPLFYCNLLCVRSPVMRVPEGR